MKKKKVVLGNERGLGVPIAVEISDGRRERCENCYDVIMKYKIEQGFCPKCIEQIWNTILDEEVSSKGIEEETGLIITTL